jgi:hypothetical protein
MILTRGCQPPRQNPVLFFFFNRLERKRRKRHPWKKTGDPWKGEADPWKKIGNPWKCFLRESMGYVLARPKSTG